MAKEKADAAPAAVAGLAPNGLSSGASCGESADHCSIPEKPVLPWRVSCWWSIFRAPRRYSFHQAILLTLAEYAATTAIIAGRPGDGPGLRRSRSLSVGQVYALAPFVMYYANQAGYPPICRRFSLV